MADNAETSSDAQITFKVKTSGDKTHTVTISEASTVKDLKNLLAGGDYENIPIDRQRLIYSGRVLKNEETIGSYKIKANNTVHMVKSAASNPSPAPSGNSSTPASTGVPSNMASGTANNPLAGLTGARYAGHQINLPGMDMFGPDGGMGPPMDEERMQRMMEDPNVQSQMNEALSNPAFIDMLVQSNPMLRNIPNAREVLQSPMMRQMMTNPSMLSNAMRMQRNMRGGNSAFPAPGATDNTPSDAPAEGEGGAQGGNNQGQQNPFASPFGPFGMGGMGGMGGGEGGNNPFGNPEQLAQQMQALMGAMGRPQGESGSTAAAPGTEGSTGATEGQQGSTGQQNPASNPFAALFGGMPGGGGAQGQDNQNNPFGMNPEMMQQMMQMMGGGGGGPQAPPDNRPPEERYENELRQLNDMGFYDFDRNVAALRRSGGSVQGAVEYLLSN